MGERLTISEKPTCLTIGGSDSCAGAGIQADLRVFETLGIKGCSVITALTAQNPEKISRIEPSPLAQIEAEIEAITSYYNVQAIKTGMLVDAERISLIASLIESFGGQLDQKIPLIIDPVMVATSGKRLLDKNSVDTLIAELVPLAVLITPNMQEAEVLLQKSIDDAMEAASELVLKLKIPVLLKGGDVSHGPIQDAFCGVDGEVVLYHRERKVMNAERAHGTGCRFASATAVYLAQSCSLPIAVEKAGEWLQSSL
jgi:hydroxymethylpyrimidine/phosphomethylpyrimidine kinase